MRVLTRFLAGVVRGTFPAPHQNVLQDRQLIRVFVGCNQRMLNQLRIDLTSSTLYGFTDHVFPLITRHAGYQKLAPADRFGEPMKARAVADEIRSHSHDNVYRHVGRVRCKEQTNECCGLISTFSERRRIEATLRPKLRESEQFLELIDEQQNS